jgi:hypothetical protein
LRKALLDRDELAHGVLVEGDEHQPLVEIAGSSIPRR